MATESTKKKHRNLKPFKKGVSGNPKGRPKGARNKLGEAFLNDLLADWEKHGVTALEATREKDPAAYVRVVASLLPKDVNVKHTIIEEIEGLSDDELRERIEQLERSVTDSATAAAQTSVH